MKDYVFESIKETQLKYKENYDSNCVLIIFEFNSIPQVLIGINSYQLLINSLNDLFRVFNTQYKCDFFYFIDVIDTNQKIREIIPSVELDIFVHEIEPELSQLIYRSNGKYYLYITMQYSTNDAFKRLDLLDKFSDEAIEIVGRYYSNIHFYNSDKNNQICHIHCLCQGIYGSYMCNRLSDEYDFEKKPEQSVAISDTYSVSDFIVFVNEQLLRSVTGLTDSIYFYAGVDKSNKTIREELIGINCFILANKIPHNGKVILGKEKTQFDAKLLFNNEELILEVTQATHKDEHLTRRKMISNVLGTRSFSLRLKQIHQRGLDSFPQSIINAIEKKKMKKYNDNRILIVCTLFEFALDNNEVLTIWIDYIQKNADKGTFRSIYLCIDSNRLIKIF